MFSMADINKISIVMATYNAGKYLESALQSIIQQNYPCLEIIIIDGKSQDNTLSIINKYQKKYSKWFVAQRHPNLEIHIDISNKPTKISMY